MIAGDIQFICNKISGKSFSTGLALMPGIGIGVKENLMREFACVEISHGSGGLMLLGFAYIEK